MDKRVFLKDHNLPLPPDVSVRWILDQLGLKSRAEEHIVKKEIVKWFIKRDLKHLCTQYLGFTQWEHAHDLLVDFLANSKKVGKLVLMPREWRKTTIATIANTIQILVKEPDSSILIASDVVSNAQNFLSVVRSHLEHPELVNLFGSFKMDHDWTDDHITIAQRRTPQHSPSVSVGGTDKVLTAHHYDDIIMDDMVNRRTIGTPDQIQKTWQWFVDSWDLLRKHTGHMFIIGTRWDENDMYGRIIKEFGEFFDVLDLGATSSKEVETGVLLAPSYLNREDLRRLLTLKGSYDFNLQYMNLVKPRGSQHFSEPVHYHESRPINEPFIENITVDLAGEDVPGSGRDPDFNVLNRCAFTRSNKLHVLEYERGHWSPLETMDRLFAMVKRSVNLVQVGIESNAYQKVMISLLRYEMAKRNQFFSIYPIHQSQDKFHRIMTLQPLWERGDILLAHGMDDLKEEFLKFPRLKHDDIVDTVEMQLQLINAAPLVFPDAKPYANLTDGLSRREWESVERMRKPKVDSFAEMFNAVGV